MTKEIDEQGYVALARFRLEIRHFLKFSEHAARSSGLTPQQHQALLAIRAAECEQMLIGDLAGQLMLKPHSASELVNRLVERGLIERRPGVADRREVRILLTDKGQAVLASLSTSHRNELRRLRPLLQRLLEAM